MNYFVPGSPVGGDLAMAAGADTPAVSASDSAFCSDTDA